MAIRTFNSVGGFSVGEVPANVILANSDVLGNSATFSGTLVNVSTGNITVPLGNVDTLRLRTDNLLYANGTPWQFDNAYGANWEIQYFYANSLNASANFTYNDSTQVLNVQGNVTALNANLGNLVVANYVTGTLTTQAQPNITSVGTMQSITMAGGTSLSGGNLVSANYVTGTLTTQAQPNITSVGTMQSISMNAGTSLSGGNLVSANYVTGTLTTKAQPNITSVGTMQSITMAATTSISGGNLVSANYVTGVLTTNAQPNITSVGTLASLAVTANANVDGNINAGNINVTGAVISNLIPGSTNTYVIGNSTRMWSNMYIGGNIFLASSNAYIYGSGNVIYTDAANVQNNLAAGSLDVAHNATIGEDLTISGNLTVSGTTTYINVQNLATKDPLILMGGSSNGANATAYDGKDRGLIFQNYLVDSSGPVNQFFGWKTSSDEFVAYSNVIDFTGEVVNSSSTLANIHGNALIGNLYGDVRTPVQSNITTVGTLSNLVIAGNLQVNTNSNLASLKAGGLTYPIVDGTSGQHLTTYGNGALYWKTVDTFQIQNGTSNIKIATADANIALSVNGTSNVIVVDSGGANVTGNVKVSGNVTANNNVLTTLVIGNSSIKSATLTTSSTTANQVIVSIPKTSFTGIEYIIKGVEASGGKYSIASISAVHDSTTVADYSIYGTVNLGGSTGTLNVYFNSATSNIELRVTPASSNPTVWTTQYRFI